MANKKELIADIKELESVLEDKGIAGEDRANLESSLAEMKETLASLEKEGEPEKKSETKSEGRSPKSKKAETEEEKAERKRAADKRYKEKKKAKVEKPKAKAEPKAEKKAEPKAEKKAEKKRVAKVKKSKIKNYEDLSEAGKRSVDKCRALLKTVRQKREKAKKYRQGRIEEGKPAVTTVEEVVEKAATAVDKKIDKQLEGGEHTTKTEVKAIFSDIASIVEAVLSSVKEGVDKKKFVSDLCAELRKRVDGLE